MHWGGGDRESLTEFLPDKFSQPEQFAAGSVNLFADIHKEGFHEFLGLGIDLSLLIGLYMVENPCSHTQ